MKELLGAAVAVASALVYDLGYVLEKQALDKLPRMEANPLGVLRVARASRRWTAGFVAMLIGLAFQVVALTLAPVSVVQPILAGGLIALAVAGSSLLGERLDRHHRAALVLIMVAVVAVAASATDTGALARRVPGGRFALLALVIAVVAVLAGRAGLRGRSAGRWTLAGLVGTALGAGLLYGLGAMSEKAVATNLVSRGFFAGALRSLDAPYPWVFVLASLTGMLLFQVGLQNHPASLMASLTNVTSTVCALVGASLVFSEAVFPDSWWSVVRIAGFGCGVAAVALLAADGDSRPEPDVAGQPRTDETRPDPAVAP